MANLNAEQPPMNALDEHHRTEKFGVRRWAGRAERVFIAVRRRFPYALWSQLLILFSVTILIDWKLLINQNGCVIWNNFVLPCSRAQYSAWIPILTTWYPFTYMGASIPVPFPLVVEQLTTWLPTVAFSFLFGPQAGAKLFMILSTVFLGWTFLQFAQGFVRTYWGRLAGAILIIAGPFQLGLYGSGDYSQFVAQGFLFLSIYFLWLAVNHPLHRWAYFPASFLALLLSISFVQIFQLGLLLYLFSFFVFGLSGRGSIRSQIKPLSRLASRLLLLPLFLTPLLLPALLAPSIALGPSSSFALPLATFRAYSASPLSVFLGAGYLWLPGTSLTNNIGYAMVASAAGGAAATIWFSLTIALVVGIWFGIVVLRSRRGLALLGLVVVASFVGAGSQGPLGSFNTFLYLHLPSYQELYTSFIWDWVIVIPATALALGIVIDRFAHQAIRAPTVGSDEAGISDHRAETALRGIRASIRRPRIRRAVVMGLGIVVVVLLTVSAVFPFAIGAQYGPVQGEGANLVGLQTVAYPADYSEIPQMLSQLVGSNYSGVAVFNPSYSWLSSNSTLVYPNYFLFYPTVRAPALPGFAIPPYPVDFYSYWVYSELYTNATRYVGQLLAVDGIQYLLVFYNTQAGIALPFLNGDNVSQLLRYQTGIAPVYSGKDFAIYRNLYYTNVAASLSEISIVAGDYSTLNAMAYGGVVLADQGVVFPGDIPAGQCTNYVNHASRIYAESTNGLEALGLACTAVSSSDPLDHISPGLQVSQGWASSYANSGAFGLNFTNSWPTPVAVTSGSGHSISIPIDVNNCPSPCSLWLPVRFVWQTGGSSLLFRWGTSQWVLDTGRAWDGFNNSMVWVQLPFSLTTGEGTLTVTSLGGGGTFNAIGEVYADANSTLNAWIQSIEVTKSVIFVTPGEILVPPTTLSPGQAWSYGELPSLDALDRAGLSLENFGSSPLTLNLTLPAQFSGWLSLLVRSFQSTNLVVGRQSLSLFGFDSGDSNFSSATGMGWIRVPVNSTELGPDGTLQLGLERGTLYLSEVTATPFSTFVQLPSAMPAVNRTVAAQQLSSNVRNLSIRTQTVSGQDGFSGSIDFVSSTINQLLGNLTVAQTPPSSADVALEYNVTPGLVVSVDGIRFSGATGDGALQFSETLEAQPWRADPSELEIQFFSWGNRSSRTTNATFNVLFEPVDLQTVSNVTDVQPGSDWTVTGDTQGYQLTGSPSSLILVRVPFYSNLFVSSPGTSLTPAFGSVDSLIWNPTNVTVLRVIPASGSYLEAGLLIVLLTLASWIVIEVVARRSHPRWTERVRQRFRALRSSRPTPQDRDQNGKGPGS